MCLDQAINIVELLRLCISLQKYKIRIVRSQRVNVKIKRRTENRIMKFFDEHGNDKGVAGGSS